jgi:DNA-binding MarR family transcriptional regulator
VDLADEFGRTAKLLGARLASRLSHHGLSMPRAQLLVALLRHGPQRISQLGGHVGISQGTASTLAEALVRDGLAERRGRPARRPRYPARPHRNRTRPGSGLATRL